MPVGSLIVGVDLAPIKPIPRVITFQSDITTDKCRATIRQHLKTWKCDTVLHDGAPNVGTAWAQDSFNQAELALQSLKLATEFLVEGGTFVTKVFRSKDYNSLLWVLNQLFNKVEATKPPSSRNVSAEIFVVCRGFKAPKRIDPRFLDPKYVFAELQGATPNNEAKVFNPEIKKRKRDGYDEGDYTLYKETAASEFIQTADPIAILGSYNKLTFTQPPNGDVALAALDKLPETTLEVRQCCEDLKVLGRRDFKLLLKWRLKVRDIFGFRTKKDAKEEEEGTAAPEEVAEVESMDEELKTQEELQSLKDKDSAKKKREKRRENERKQREIVRMQLNMVAPMDIGMEESGPVGDGSMFSLKKIDKTDGLNRLARGRMSVLPASEQKKEKDSGIGSSAGTDDESDSDGDRLEGELDNMYNRYQERKSEADAKFRAKKAREEHEDGEWEGLSADEQSNPSDSSDLGEEDDSDDDDEGGSGAPRKGLIRDLDDGPAEEGGLSKRASTFFSQDIFKDITDSITNDTNTTIATKPTKEKEPMDKANKKSPKERQTKTQPTYDSDSEMTGSNGQFEVVKRAAEEEQEWDGQDDGLKDGRPGTLTPFMNITMHPKLTIGTQISILSQPRL